MAKIRNLTPHDVVIVNSEGSTTTFASEGALVRCTETLVEVGVIDGIPLKVATYGEVTGLPPQEEGVFLIVSALVRMAARRSDLVSPGEQVRDSAGKIIGCKCLLV